MTESRETGDDSELDNPNAPPVHPVSFVEIENLTSERRAVSHIATGQGAVRDDGADTLIMRRPRERRLNISSMWGQLRGAYK